MTCLNGLPYKPEAQSLIPRAHTNLERLLKDYVLLFPQVHSGAHLDTHTQTHNDTVLSEAKQMSSLGTHCSIIHGTLPGMEKWLCEAEGEGTGVNQHPSFTHFLDPRNSWKWNLPTGQMEQAEAPRGIRRAFQLGSLA